MPRLPIAPIIAGIFVLLVPVLASACTILDPVTTHTNGMPLASSQPERSHNAYYKCDPDRTGCCGGRYNFACLNSLLRPDCCCTKNAAPYYGEWGTAVGSVQDVEPTRFERLGVITADPLLTPGTGR